MTTHDAQHHFRRLIYTSAAAGDDQQRDHLDILRQSRANNGLNGVSGLLWTDGAGYLQVLEGAPEAVSLTFDRIAGDPRHRNLRVVSDRVERERAFGDWTMASLPAERDGAVLRERVDRFLRVAPDDVRTAFHNVGF